MAPTKFYIGLGAALLLGVGVAMFGAHYRELQHSAQQNENRGQVLTNASAGVQEGTDIDEFKAGYNAALAANRSAFQQAKQEAIRNEPETATRAVRNVPDSVRNAYRERRRARERLGCAGGECRQDDAPDVTP